MNRLLYTALLVLSTAYAFSQAPGYMGKRFVLGYGLYANPRLTASGGSRGVNLLHEGYLEFAMKKTISVGVSARFYKAMYTNTREVNALDYYASYSTQLDQSPNGFINIKGRNYALYFKFYKRNYVAPWGKYVLLGVTLNTFTSTYDPDNMYVTTTNDYTKQQYLYRNDFGPTTQSYKRFDIMFGNGRNRVIANRITLDYGYTINLIALTTAVFDAADDPIIDADGARMNDYIELTSAARMRSVNKFNLYLKVGVLLF
jgi:hypothetical protein